MPEKLTNNRGDESYNRWTFTSTSQKERAVSRYREWEQIKELQRERGKVGLWNDSLIGRLWGDFSWRSGTKLYFVLGFQGFTKKVTFFSLVIIASRIWQCNLIYAEHQLLYHNKFATCINFVWNITEIQRSC